MERSTVVAELVALEQALLAGTAVLHRVADELKAELGQLADGNGSGDVVRSATETWGGAMACRREASALGVRVASFRRRLELLEQGRAV